MRADTALEKMKQAQESLDAAENRAMEQASELQVQLKKANDKIKTLTGTISSSALGANMEENAAQYLQNVMETVAALMKQEFSDAMQPGDDCKVTVSSTGKQTGMMDHHACFHLMNRGQVTQKILIGVVESKNGGDANKALASPDVKKWTEDCERADRMYGEEYIRVQKGLMTSRKKAIQFCDQVGHVVSGLVVAGILNNPAVTRDFVAEMAHAVRGALKVHFAHHVDTHDPTDQLLAEVNIMKQKNLDLGNRLVQKFDRDTTTLHDSMVALMKNIDTHTKDEQFVERLRSVKITDATQSNYQDITNVTNYWTRATTRGKQYKTTSTRRAGARPTGQQTGLLAKKRKDDMGGPDSKRVRATLDPPNTINLIVEP